MIKKPRGSAPKDRPRGGKEAARTVVTVLRQMFGWAIEENKLTRKDNPVAGMEKNLPKKKRGERVLSLREAREAWRAAGDLGYPFGPAYQLALLTGDRRGEWSSCIESYLDFEQALQVLVDVGAPRLGCTTPADMGGLDYRVVGSRATSMFASGASTAPGAWFFQYSGG